MRGWVLPLALVGLLAGCQNEPQTDRVLTVEPDALCASVDPVTGVWESVPWSQESCPCASCLWLSYPGETALEVPHDLGRVPAAVLPYLSFREDGSGATLASGSIAQVLQVTDEHVTLANNTDQPFYLRLVLQ